MRLLRGWRPALRIARREAVRARGRSVLVLVMIGLPVLGIVALDTLARTASVSSVEGLSREIGSADALVSTSGSAAPVDQTPDMSSMSGSDIDADTSAPPTRATVRSVLGPGTRVLERVTGRVAVRTDVGVARPATFGLDLQDPMTRGLFDPRDGRYPRTAEEVVVSPRLAGRGFPVGSTLTLADGSELHVVGTVESTTTHGESLLVGQSAAVGLDAASTVDSSVEWLVSRPGGVDWDSVRALNREGMYAKSRLVIEDPPSASEVTMQSYNSGLGSAEIAVLALVVAMALLEVVLLAGPAFAVGARRQQRALALMAASGAEPPHLRRVVLASGVVLGTAAAVAGSVLGVGIAWLAQPIVQHFSDSVLGPFEVAPRDIAAIAAIGLFSALLAALLPAVMAARSDVVAILAGRRGETKTALWSPVLGALMLTAGIVGAAYGAVQPNGGETFIAGAAILGVLGMVLLTPLVLGLLGHLARLLPLPARFAVRDAARHRSRTAPAVAAVAATVAGVVALGIGGTSDAAENRAMYTPTAPMGVGVIQSYGIEGSDDSAWQRFAGVVHRELPDAQTTFVRGMVGTDGTQLRLEPDADSWSAPLGSDMLVGPAALGALGLAAADERRARAALARGDVVLLSHSPLRDGRVELVRESWNNDGSVTELGSSTHPAVTVSAPGAVQPARGVLPASVAKDAGLPVITTGLLVRGATIDQSAEDAIDEGVAGLEENTSLYVERGFHDDSTQVMLLLLGSIGGVLVLGGTLTATFLAMSDARPDFATMGAVGADPRTRRWVAAAYAGTIGLVGATLGAAVGFIPGIAISFPLTGSSWAGEGATTTEGTPLPDHFLDIPWLLVLGLVVVLPLLTAAVVGLTSRSRLPMVSRLS